MEITSYLLIILGLCVALYVFYRLFFLKTSKKKHRTKPHFTLKIETE